MDQALLWWQELVDYSPRWRALCEELEPYGIRLPPYRGEGMFFVPNGEFGADRSLALAHDGDPWRRLVDLVDPSSSHARALIDCIPIERSREL